MTSQHRLRLPDDGAPTTGNARLDVLTTALGMHLLVDPAVVDILCVSWLANAVPTSASLPTLTQHLSSLIHRLLNDTHKCDLSIFAIPFQRAAKMEFLYHLRFFANRSDLGLVNNRIEAEDEASRDRGDSVEGVFAPIRKCLREFVLLHRRRPQHLSAFALHGRTGIGGELKWEAFLGSARLRHYYDPVYFVRMACWRAVEMVNESAAIRALSDERKLVGLAAMWDSVSRSLFEEHARAASSLSDRVRAECLTLSQLFVEHRLRLDRLLEAMAARAQESMTEHREKIVGFCEAVEAAKKDVVEDAMDLDIIPV